jgi:hypothetical protein
MQFNFQTELGIPVDVMNDTPKKRYVDEYTALRNSIRYHDIYECELLPLKRGASCFNDEYLLSMFWK